MKLMDLQGGGLRRRKAKGKTYPHGTKDVIKSNFVGRVHLDPLYNNTVGVLNCKSGNYGSLSIQLQYEVMQQTLSTIQM